MTTPAQNRGAPTRGATQGAACWTSIGVEGDRSCAKLAEHVHCRNCGVFGSAAAQLLDRPAPPDYLETATRHFARPKEDRPPETHSVVIFRLGDEWLALATPIVTEIATARPIHSLPHRRSGVVLGIVNIRGAVVVAVSLARLLGVGPAAAGRQDGRSFGRLLVIAHGQGPVAVPVDEVYGVHRFPQSAAGPVPTAVGRAPVVHTQAVFSWNGHAVGWLDEQRIFEAIGRSLA